MNINLPSLIRFRDSKFIDLYNFCIEFQGI